MGASTTKYALTGGELHEIVRSAFGGARAHESWSELTEGFFNAVFAVVLDDGTEVILKVAPSPGLGLLTHESGLMATECEVYRRAGELGVAVPEVVHVDLSRRVIDTDFVFLSRVAGVSFDAVREEMSDLQRHAVRAQVAHAARTLHTVTGASFGYPHRHSRSWQPTWRGAFGAMVADILDDAERLASSLPATPHRIGAILERHAEVLDAVDRPALVHFDLWDGNVLVEREADDWRLRGIIDAERAFYGDPVAELCSIGLFRELDQATLTAFGELDTRAARWLSLYTAYLYLIMLVEGATRGWHDEERTAFEAWLSDQLNEVLRRL